jgi:hypothetical protein
MAIPSTMTTKQPRRLELTTEKHRGFGDLTAGRVERKR